MLCEFDGNGNVSACYGYGATGLVQRWAKAGTAFHYTAYTFDPMHYNPQGYNAPFMCLKVTL